MIFFSEETTSSVGVAVTEEELILMMENYQWPLPRLQAPLSEEVKGQQFTIQDRQKINNIATVVSFSLPKEEVSGLRT